MMLAQPLVDAINESCAFGYVRDLVGSNKVKED